MIINDNGSLTYHPAGIAEVGNFDLNWSLERSPQLGILFLLRIPPFLPFLPLSLSSPLTVTTITSRVLSLNDFCKTYKLICTLIEGFYN